MLTRAISGVVLLIILGITMTSGGPILFGFTLFISLIAYLELIKVTGVRLEKDKVSGVEMMGYLGILSYYSLRYFAHTDTFVCLTFVLTIMAMLLIYVFSFPKYSANQIMAGVFSFMYAPIMLSYIYLTRELPQGKYLVWLIFCASWACDTAAYCVGMLIGKHKLAPVLSPKKSIEGAIGGVIGAALVGYLYAFALYKFGLNNMDERILWVFPLISACGSVLSQLGDLAASGIKRNYEIKDYGKLIPGHGGIMDRFDSVCVTAPLIYYLSILLLNLG